MEYDVKKLAELTEAQKSQAMDIFVEGFYNIFSVAVSKDKTVLHKLMSTSFDPEMVYIGLQEELPVGFFAIGNSQKRPVKINLETCKTLFGERKGAMLCKQMGAMLEKVNVNQPDEAYIDYVATSPAHRGKGVAGAMFRYLFAHLQYRVYTLEVLSKNLNAKRLYEGLGFVKVKTGFNIMTMLFRLGRPIFMRKNLGNR